MPLMFSSSESDTAKTAVIMKIPIMTPSRDSIVLSRLVTSDCHACTKLSTNNRRVMHQSYTPGVVEARPVG